MEKKCIITMSGGLDSTTIIALAKSENYKIYGLTFNYNQRNMHEINCALEIAKYYDIDHKIFNLNLGLFGGSSLTDSTIQTESYHDKELPNNIPNTYVPARNTIFLSIALAYAETVGANTIFCGANKSDYVNYPDCRPEFFSAFNKMAQLGTKFGSNQDIQILTPLIFMEKSEIIRLGIKLNVDYSKTLSCYNPSDDGHACGICLSCSIRKQNFSNAGVEDPTIYSANNK